MRLGGQVVGVQRHRRRVERVDHIQEDRRPRQHREDRRTGQGREHHEHDPWPTGAAGQHARRVLAQPAGRSRPAQPDAGEDAKRGSRTRAPPAGPPPQPHRDDGEREGQHQLEGPRRNPERDLAAYLHLDDDHVDRRPGQQRGDGRAHGRGEPLRDLPRRPLRDEGGGGEGDQLVLACRKAGAQEADPQRQVLHERNRPRNAPGDDGADHDLGQRQQRHRRQRAGGEQLLGPVQESEHGRGAARDGAG